MLKMTFMYIHNFMLIIFSICAISTQQFKQGREIIFFSRTMNLTALTKQIKKAKLEMERAVSQWLI